MRRISGIAQTEVRFRKQVQKIGSERQIKSKSVGIFSKQVKLITAKICSTFPRDHCFNPVRKQKKTTFNVWKIVVIVKLPLQDSDVLISPDFPLMRCQHYSFFNLGKNIYYFSGSCTAISVSGGSRNLQHFVIFSFASCP